MVKFRQGGWQRVNPIGKTQETLDLYLLAPLTGERVGVQIKSVFKKTEFEEYQKDTGIEIELYFGEKIADLTISAGLVDWVIKKKEFCPM